MKSTFLFLLTTFSTFSLGAEPFKMLDYRWGNQITECLLTMMSDGSYIVETGKTISPRKKITKGKLSQKDLRDLQSDIEDMDNKTEEYAEEFADGSRIGQLIVFRSPTDKGAIVQQRGPKWNDETKDFTVEAYSVYDTNPSREAIVNLVNGLVEHDMPHYPQKKK